MISHGNGPQVGLLALQGSAYTEVDPYPLDLLGAQTEGMIGYLIQQELGNELPFEKRLASLLTLIEVDADDPAFGDPTKPIGPIYDAGGVGAARQGEGLGVQARRRQLPPRRPLAAAAADLRDRAGRVAARARLRRHLRGRRRHPGHVHRRAGAGRAAARRRRGRDRQGPRERAARRATCGADALAIVTDVDAVYAGWGTPEQRAIRRATPGGARRAPSSRRARWGRRSSAACSFVEQTGGLAAIGSIADTAGARSAARRARSSPATRTDSSSPTSHEGARMSEHAAEPAPKCRVHASFGLHDPLRADRPGGDRDLDHPGRHVRPQRRGRADPGDVPRGRAEARRGSSSTRSPRRSTACTASRTRHGQHQLLQLRVALRRDRRRAVHPRDRRLPRRDDEDRGDPGGHRHASSGAWRAGSAG